MTDHKTDSGLGPKKPEPTAQSPEKPTRKIPDVAPRDLDSSSMTTNPGERARSRKGVQPILMVAAACLVVGLLFLFAITRGNSPPLANPPAPSGAALAAPMTASSGSASVPSSVPSDPVAAATSAASPPNASVASPQPLPDASGPTKLEHLPSSPHTTAIGPATTDRTQGGVSVPKPPASPAASGNAPNPWKIKEH